MKPRPRVAVSACLLGQAVRYDGDHRRNALVVERLGRLFEWIPLCPEVEAGFGVPRETLRLELPGRTGGAVDPRACRLVTTGSRIDRTESMRAYAAEKAGSLSALGLCGAILKRGSPSCGVSRVKLHCQDRPGDPLEAGIGLFAQALLERFPGLPVADEGMLEDERAARDFVRRVFVG